MGQHFHDVWVIGMPRRNKIPTLQYWLPIKLSGNPQRTTTKLLLTSCRSYHSTRKTHCSKGLGRTDGPGCFLAEDVVHEDAMLHMAQGTPSRYYEHLSKVVYGGSHRRWLPCEQPF